MPRSSPKRSLGWRALGRSLAGGTSISVLATAGLCALALGSWTIVALGGLAYSALVGWDFFRDDSPSGASDKRAQNLAWLGRLTHPPVQIAAANLVRARADLQRVIDETPAELRGYLASAVLSSDELYDHAVQLILRANDLARYLASVDVNQAQADAAELRDKARDAHDDEARAKYEKAGAAKEEQLAVIGDITVVLDRILASVSGILATLQGLPPKVVRMQALDAQTRDNLAMDVSDELDRTNVEVRAFEDTLRSLAEVTRR